MAERQEMDKGGRKFIPESERKCVWMLSGIISYKLCPSNFACDECMFDRVMRNESAAMIRRPEVDAALAADLAFIESSSPRIDGSLFYHKNHCWVRVISPEEVRIGINGILARLIYGIKTIVLPKVGDVLKKNQYFTHIIQEKHIVPVILPADGMIISVNSDLMRNPDLLRTGHHDEGWLVTLKPDNLENDLRELFFGSSAAEWYRESEKAVSEAIHAAYSISGQAVGATMADGGEFMLSASDIFTPEQYYKILEVISTVDKS
jgi:glycine cleavage system H protein